MKNNYITEEELDSSINEYEIKYKTGSDVKQLYWDMAIGLQEVDNLKPSKYLEKLKNENIDGTLTIKDLKKELKHYYSSREEVNEKELECDFVSTRIVELLHIDNFELSVERKVNFSKCEKILNNDTVSYGDYNTLTESLGYDMSKELEKDYSSMNIKDVINSITEFSSNIWQVHPFREGNTRVTAVFIEKYLISLGYDVDNTLFKDKSIYFRNALVRSNYFNNHLNIKEDNSFLIKFYENLLLNKNNNLSSRDLIVIELFE